ncbi:MAG: TolC family protein [Rhodothermales bacterium]
MKFIKAPLILLLIVYLLPVSASAQEKTSYNIGMLVDSVTPETLKLFAAMEAEITAVVGEDAIINFPPAYRFSNQLDLDVAEQQYQTLLSNDTDIILAFGQVNNAVISRQEVHTKPTILFGAVNLDLIEIDENKATSGIDNFTYLISSQSYTRDLSAFKLLYDFEHVGIVMEDALESSDVWNGSEIEELFDDIFEQLGAEYTIIPYDSPASLDPHLDQIDAVYVAEGFFLTEAEVRALAEKLFENEVPSFTSTPRQDVELGLMATNQSEENIGQFFRRIALNVEAIVNGQNLSDLPLYIDFSETLTINFNTAEKTGVPIKYSLIATTDFVGDFTNVISEETYSAIDVINGVLENNLILQLGQRDVQLSEQDVEFAKSNYLPSLTTSLSGTYLDSETAELSNGSNPEYSTAGNATLSQTIFSEGANANISIQKSLLKATQEDFNATELDLILNATNAYFNTLILKSNLQIRSQNLDLTKRNLKIAEQNFEAGQTGRTDVLRFQSEMASNMQALVEAVNQLEQGFYAINQLVNNPIDREIDVEDARLSEGVFEGYSSEQLRGFIDDPSLRKLFVDFLVEEAKKNAPEIRSLSYNLEATERNILLNGSRRFLPIIAAQAQYNRTFDQWGAGAPPPEFALKDNYNVGVSLSIPIIDRNQRSINRQTALIQKEQLELSQENVALSIDKNVKDAVLDLVNQIANIELSRVAESSAQQSLELTQSAYTSGAVNIVQLLDAQNNYLQAQLSRANANYNYLLTSLILERYLGYFFLLHSEEENQAFLQRFSDYQTQKDQ